MRLDDDDNAVAAVKYLTLCRLTSSKSGEKAVPDSAEVV